MKAIIESVFKGQALTRAQSRSAMESLLRGDLSREQVAAFLGAIQARRETVDEMLGFLDAILAQCPPVPLATEEAIDVCGTGGDGSNTFNISTAVALLVAAGGVPVAKHGNRSVSSACGSADVLEALGIRLESDPRAVANSIADTGFGFFFAPHFHGVLASVRDVRKAIGVKTVFNLLGPLCNPARVRRQLMGVYDPGRLVSMAEILRANGAVEAMVVCSEDGLDEFSIEAPTLVAHLKNGGIREFRTTPGDFGLAGGAKSALTGGAAHENAAIIRAIFAGERGPRRDVVVMNAAAALVVAGATPDFKSGRIRAENAIDSGKALALLARLKAGAA